MELIIFFGLFLICAAMAESENETISNAGWICAIVLGVGFFL